MREILRKCKKFDDSTETLGKCEDLQYLIAVLNYKY